MIKDLTCTAEEYFNKHNIDVEITNGRYINFQATIIGRYGDDPWVKKTNSILYGEGDTKASALESLRKKVKGCRYWTSKNGYFFSEGKHDGRFPEY